MAEENNSTDLHGVDEQHHPVWSTKFNRQLRSEQIEDDLFAGRTVSRLLTIIVAAGALLSFATLLVIMASQ